MIFKLGLEKISFITGLNSKIIFNIFTVPKHYKFYSFINLNV